jgi:trimeric autotransporter adhesin
MAAIALTGKTQASGINYTYTTASSADWSSVPSSTYFYDLTDKLVHYKDSGGNILEAFGPTGNIYSQDGSLSAVRTVTLTASNSLTFTGGTTHFAPPSNSQSALTINRINSTTPVMEFKVDSSDGLHISFPSANTAFDITNGAASLNLNYSSGRFYMGAGTSSFHGMQYGGSTNNIFYQNYVGFGVGEPNNNTKVAFEVASTTKGALLPRMTTAQRTAISTTVNEEGLTVYDTDIKAYFLWNGTAWKQISYSSGGNPIDGSGTANTISKWSDSNTLTDGTWAFNGNDIYPLVTGSNIGNNSSPSFRIGTIYMSSVIDFANDLSFDYIGVPLVTMKTGGNVGIGTTSPNRTLSVNGTLSIGDSSILSFSTIDILPASGIFNQAFGGVTVNQISAYQGYDSWFGATSGTGRAQGSTGGGANALFYIQSQSAADGAAGGTGAKNFIDNTGRFGMGTITPGSKLHVKGSGSTSATMSVLVQNSSALNSLTILDDGSVYNLGAGAVSTNTAFGNGSLVANTTGNNNVAIGGQVLNTATAATFCVAVGYQTMQTASGTSNVGMGYQNLRATTSPSNTAIGHQALSNATSGTGQNVAVGATTMYTNTTGNQNTAVGYQALFFNSTGHLNIAVGYKALQNSIVSGAAANVAVGASAGFTNSAGTSNVFLGNSAGYWETGSSKLFIDNTNRTDEADARLKSLVYGVFDAAVANQRFNINGTVGIGGVAASTTSLSVQGFGTTSATYGLKVQNSTGTNNALIVRDDGTVGVGTASPTAGVHIVTTSTGIPLKASVGNVAGVNIADFQLNGTSLFTINSSGWMNLSTAAGAQNSSFTTNFNIGSGGGANITSESKTLAVGSNSLAITGGYSTQRYSLFSQSSISAASALTVVTASNINIAGAPTALTSALITNSIGLQISAGSSLGSGVTNGYGLHVTAPTGATNNYAATFSGNVGVGTTAPTSTLQVVGSGSTSATTSFSVKNSSAVASLTVLDDGSVYNFGPGAVTTNTAFGNLAFIANSTGSNSVSIGVESLKTTTSGSNNTAVGHQAMMNATASFSVAIGQQALKAATGNDNVALGYSAAISNLGGLRNISIGSGASFTNTVGSSGVSIGYLAAYFGTGSRNISIGDSTAKNNTGANNVVIGYQTGFTGTAYSGNVIIGYNAGFYETGSNKLFIDNAARANEADGRLKSLIYGVFDAAVANQRLTINGTVGIGGVAASADSLTVQGFGTTSATFGLKVHNSTGTNNALVVRDDGNVGIGTASPGSTLDVTGTGNISTSLTTPLLIGGSGVTSRITYQSTTGNATTTAVGHRFTGGNNGATILFQMTNDGSVSIGGTPTLSNVIRITRNITGNITARAAVVDGEIQSDVTSSARAFDSAPSTNASSFVLGNLHHFIANDISLGAGSSVTTQNGFVANGLSSATNNRGFVGQVASGSTNYNLYMSGTAKNYMNGNLGIGTNSPNTPLHVVGSATIGDNENVINTVKVSLTAGQVSTLSSSPVLCIPAPAAGYAIRVVRASVALTFVSAAYTSSTQVFLYTDTATLNQASCIILLATTSMHRTFIDVAAGIDATSTQLISAKGLYLKTAGDPASGDSGIDLYITYELIKI